MIVRELKRWLSLLLALVMILSAVPLQAFAAEVDDHDHEHDAIATEPVVTEPVVAEPVVTEPEDGNPSELAVELTDRVNAIVEDYGLSADMTEDEVFEAMYEKSDDELFATMDEMEALAEAAENATEADAEYIMANAELQAYGKLCDAMNLLSEIALLAASGTHTPVTGVTVSVSGATDNSMSSGAVTVTAKGSGGIFGIGASSKTATIKIYNESGAKAKLSFDWTASSINELKIDGTKYTGSSGSFEKVMDAGEEITVTITTAKNSTTNKLVMKNFACDAVKESSKVTFQYDNSLGSITVDGNATANGDAKEIPSAGAALTATAKDGVTFLGWIDANTHAILSKAATFTLEPADDMTVLAVFAKTSAWFLVNGNALYEGLDAALEAVENVTNKTIVLANNGTLPAGTYTIPSGVTLLIPYNDTNTLCTTAPTTSDTAYKDNLPKVYRKLTMEEGANIVINGALSLSATQSASGGASAPIGNCSFIQMNSGSNITVNNGGKLYAWGYIQGSGSVTVEKGGTVYECFQVMDWRGGDNTSGMVNNEYRVFPMSQYYIQNVEVPMTLKAGAIEKGYMSVQITMVGIQGAAVPFIGSDGMFQINSGYIVKDYDESTGRLLIDTYGDLSVKSLSISMKLGLLGSTTINSSKYTLPINGNMTITMHSGSMTMTQDIALTPGARLIVGKDASCTLGSGNKIYVYDRAAWREAPNSFCSTGGQTHMNLKYPASATTVQGRDEDAYVEVNGTADLSAGNVYTTATDACNVVVNGTGTIIMRPSANTNTHMADVDNKNITYVAIPVASPKLQNADGTQVITANDKGKVTYTSVNGTWTCAHTYKEGTCVEEITKAATCLLPGVKTITCNCGEDSKTEEIAALGHTEVIDNAVAPTCTETGLTEGKHCSVCNEVFAKQQVVPALGHTAGAAATCTTAQTCTVCGAELVAALGHTAGAAATCTTAQTCTVCGEELVAKLGHTAGAAATCTTAQTCTVCGEELAAKLGHTAGAAATCTTAQTCTVCGEELVAKLGHTEVIDKAVASTCTETGLTEGKHCSVCGETLVEQEEVAALGHAWEWFTDKEATVLESGIKHEECSRCHEKRNENTEIPILACSHEGTMTGTEAKDATCTEGGNSAYWYCSACQNYYSDAAGQHEIEENSWVIDALGHKHVGVVTAPTCLDKGYTTYTCPACGDTYVDDEVAALGHKHVGVVTAPTCLDKGYTTYTCSVCGDTYVDDEVAALGHSHVAETTYPAGVTKGYTVYTCSCGDSYRTEWLDEKAYEGKTIVAFGDSITAGVGVTVDQNDYVKLLADQLGMNYIRKGFSGTTLATGGSRTCNIVNFTEANLNGADVVTILMGINDFVAAEDGQYELGNINSTDTSTIYGAVKMWCERIEELKKTDSLSNTQFYFVTPVITSWKNSSVRDWDQSKTNDNDYTLRDLCNAIKEVAALYDIAVIDLNLLSGLYYADAEDNNVADFGGTDGAHPGASGHKMMADAMAKALLQSDLRDDHTHTYGSWITTTWPYCAAGEKHQVCSVCGHVSAGVEVPFAGHIVVTHEAKVPTCQEGGWKAYETCARCDYNTKVELPADPDGHIWDEGTPYGNHSCNTTSYIIYNCTLCNEENWVVDELKHFRVPIAEEIPATCTEDGMTSGWKCEKCHEFWIPQEVIPALGHDWNEKYPCQNETSACTRCDLHFDSKQEHLVVIDPAVPATCTSTGLTEGSHCGYCGEILVAQTETPMADHEFMIADMEIPARCGIIGHKEGASYCIHCEYDEDPIPALDHSWIHRDAKKPTYTVVGWNAHDYCLLCNAIRTLEEYEGKPCEFCGDEPEGYMEIPKLEVQANKTVADTLTNLEYLEQMAEVYAFQNPGADALGLVLNYLRTGVSNYTSGSWAIMAGPEDKAFLKFVQEMEDTINNDPELNVWINVSGLKKLSALGNTYGELNVYKTNGAKAPLLSGHFFGTMDMTYHNKGSQNHADVGGWVGDLTDLLSTSDEFGVPADLTLDEKVEYIREHYLFKDNVAGSAGAYGSNDLYADLDAFYFMNELITNGYETGDLVKLMREYYQSGLTLNKRAGYLIDNRLDGLSTRKDLREAVYNAYTSNKLIATLEGTRNFKASGNELTELRKAVCYAFADELCRLAGDYVEDLDNPRFTVFDSETKILAPGVSQQISYATNADGKQIVYYIATADVTRDDVGVWVNYYDRDPGTPENPQWKNNSVPSSAQNAQDRYGDPNSPDYIENFNVIASTNAGGYDMSDVATPGGLVVMNGIEWFPQSTNAGFFAILNDGTAYMGTYDEYEGMMAEGKIKEAIGGFGEFVVQDGKVVGNATYSDAPRTSVGITSTGRVVLMCIDGRQAPFSSGASLQDVGYIMKEAGCVVAINLDGGGSTTFVARQPGSDELTVMNRPSDGYPRNVSTNLLIYSTAPSSTAFDHAVVDSAYDYATIGTPVQMTAAGVSPSGSAVDIPEGATWVVANEDMASITEDGVFVGKRLGEVNVYLMLGEQNIGTKRMTIGNPDQLYFERAKVDAIYGSNVKLPLRARIEGKEIAINPNDVTITLSAPNAGTMDGFTFQAAESTVKTMTITAAIGEDIKASINVMLYKQGENSFDFENATGGDRTLAWYREVSNAEVEDGNIYNVIDPTKDMVASYIFAMDMTTIPIPERIAELTYMLPGGTMEGATAWSFLLSLAQRISDMSWVKATIDFDDRFDVDYSELKILNDYFTMKEMTFDEATNTLTVTMNWIKQSQVIDAATANPLCLINGIKLTPKAGVWTEDVTKINAVTSGNIGYEIYMRASGLYGFAQKPESQAVFGLYPYRNPADTTDAGGYFRDTYAEITDTFTLVNVLKEGWVNEDGGFAYYVDGERLTGVQEVDGIYYDFGEQGVNVGQTKLTGLFFDEQAQVYRYSYIGELADGWQSIGEDWYYFKNFEAVSGAQKIGGVKFVFEENGRLTSGTWANVFTGWRYYYGPTYYASGWANIDENWYYFRNGLRVTGISETASMENGAQRRWYDFGEDGANRGLFTGFVTKNDKLYFATEGAVIEKGLFKWEGEHYYAQYDGSLIVNKRYYAWLLDSSSELPLGWYDFGSDGRVLGGNTEQLNGIVEKNGILYYYENGKPTEKGLFVLDGYYYNARYDGRLIVDQTYYAWLLDSSSELPVGNYEFGTDGRMLHGIVDKGGTLYYYEYGKRVEKGLFQLDGYYYNAAAGGKLITNQKYYVWNISSGVELPKGNYEFDADGRMLQGIVDKSGVLYYYVDGKPTEMGLFYLDGYHYYAQYDGKLITNQKYYAWKLHSSSQLPIAHYEFAEDGRVLGSCSGGEITNKNGVLYYYEDGKPTEKGLFVMDGYYYYSQWDGKLITNDTYYAWKLDASSDLPVGHYEFDEGGRMLQGIVDKSGVLYYYLNGKRTEMGLFKIGDDYYNARYDGKLITSQKYYAWLINENCDLPADHYEFGADGRMLQGIINKNGTQYFYENGKPTEKGLFVYEGDYYYSQWDGQLIRNQTYYAWKLDSTSELPVATYEFDADGKMIGASSTGEIIEKNGEYYYYENGKPVEKGLFFLDGYYYFAHVKGRLITSQRYYVWNGNDLLLEKHYTFNELGQIVG